MEQGHFVQKLELKIYNTDEMKLLIDLIRWCTEKVDITVRWGLNFIPGSWAGPQLLLFIFKLFSFCFKFDFISFQSFISFVTFVTVWAFVKI